MHFLYVQKSPNILILVAQDGVKMILLTQQVIALTQSCHQLDKQIIDKTTYVKNNCFLCIYLTFCTNQNVISKHGAVSIFDTCHHNIIYGKINICVSLPSMLAQEV